MSGGGGKTISSESPRLSTIRLNQSAYGSAVPWVRGTNRLAGNLIWYSDFTAIPHTSTEEMGGKGGGGGGMKSTTYTYTCALAISLCEGEIVDIGQVWSSKDKTTLADLGFTLFKGTLPQTAWSYLTTAHPTEALGYPGIAYIANGKLNLGDSADLPNLSFEVKGPRTIGEIVVGTPMLDARPDEILTDLLTDPLSGAGFDGNLIQGLTSYRTYCQAAGFFVSPAISEQSTANDHVKALMAMTNSETVWSEGKLKVVPYGDSPVTGNGVTWTPDVTPLFDLTDDDFIADAGDDIIRINRKRPADAYNRVQIEFNNRALEYNTDIGEAKDGANIAQFGLRPKDPVQMHWITRREMADQVADLIMRRELYILNEYEFKLGWRYGMLEAMDIVTLTHASLGLNHAVVRIISADESPDGDIDIVAEEMPWSNATPAKVVTQSGSGAAVDYNIAPGNSNAPVMFEPPISLSGAPELWLATSGGANWGGCEVWVSMDDATYTRIGNVTAPARHGVLTATMAAGSDPDVSTTVAVDLGVSRGTLAGGTLEERDLLTTLSWVDGEFISFQNAALTGSYRYDLTSLRRGVSGSAVAMHSAGAKFTRIDGAIFKYAYDASMLSKTIYVKLRSFNVYGSGLQDLASLTPVTYVIAGAPVGTVTGLAAEQPFTGRSARIKWDVMAGSIAYEVEVWAGSVLRRSLEISETRFEYTFEDSIADGGPYRAIEFRIKAISESGVSSSAAILSLSNPQVGMASNIMAVSAGSSLSISADMPAITDFAATKIWISASAGFDPAATAPAYIGPNNFYTTPLTPGTYYYRIGFYDVFGADSMNISSESSIAVAGSAGGIDPVATLPGSASIGRVVFLTTDSKLYRYTSTGWSRAADGGDLLAGSVTADRISVANLAAISANMGTITAGSITLDALGFVRGGQTAYNTGAGFWLGYDAGAYKFSLGNSAGNNLTWDGTTLTLKGALDAATGTFSGALSGATGTFSGSLSAATGTFAGSLSAATGSFAGSLSAATGSFAGSLSAATGSFAGSLSAASGTLGALNIAAGGNVKMGQTAFNTGTGFWLGDDGGTPKLSFGNPSGGYFTWDGSNIIMAGAIMDNRNYTAGSVPICVDPLIGSKNFTTGAINTYYLVKEIYCPNAGTLTVSFSLGTTQQNNISGRIYKNGVAAGTVRTVTNGGGSNLVYTTFSQDITVTAGQLLQIYVASANITGGVPAYVKEFKTMCGFPGQPCIVTRYTSDTP